MYDDISYINHSFRFIVNLIYSYVLKMVSYFVWSSK